MNAGPTLIFWLQLLGSLALETGIMFLFAFALQRFARTGVWRRTIWQVGLLGMGLIALLDLTGVSRATVGWTASQFRSTRPAVVARNNLPPLPVPAVEPAFIENATQMALPVPVPIDNQKHQDRFAWWPGIVWLAGFGFVVGRAGLFHLLFVILRQRKQLAADSALSERIGSLAGLLGMQRRVRVTHISKLHGPVAFGIFHPTISLPEGFAAHFDAGQREAMLIHELAHLAARDPLWYLLADVVTGLLWWHPLVWVARRQFQMASELAADEASLLLENGPNALAECLVELGMSLAQPRSYGWLGIEGNGFRSGLGRRVEKLLGLTGRSWQPVNGAGGRLAKAGGPAVLACVAMAGAALALPHPEGHAAKTIAQNWERSVAGLAIEAVRNANERNADEPLKPAVQVSREAIPSLVRDAKLLLDADKLDQAEGLLDEVLKVEPANQTANDYWNLIQEKRKTQAGQLLLRNQFTNTPLSRFQAILATNQSQLGKAPLERDRAATIPANKPPVGPNSQAPVNAVQTSNETSVLHTRSFRIDPNTLAQGLNETAGADLLGTNALRDGWAGVRGTAGKTNAPGEIITLLRHFFEAAGVDISPPKSLFYNDRSGLLMVRVTLQDMSIIEQALHVLNASPPQVMIGVKFCEIKEDGYSPLGVDPLLGLISMPNSTNLTSTGILTDRRYQALIKALEEKSGVDLLTTPKVTTLSGRQAQIKAVNVKYVVTDLNITTNRAQGATGEVVSTVMQPITERMELGPVIDVVPYVSADGYTLQMKVNASLKEFLGYDNAEGFVATIREANGHDGLKPPKTSTTPLPRFRVRQVSTSANVWDGQTLVLDGGSFIETEKGKDQVPLLGDLPLVGRLFRSESSIKTRKRLLIFITPTVVDPSGNRMHSEEEMPFATKSVPAHSPAPRNSNGGPAR